jgi:hypothetical protein
MKMNTTTFRDNGKKKNHIHKQKEYKTLNFFENESLATTIVMMLNLDFHQPLQPNMKIMLDNLKVMEYKISLPKNHLF